MTVDGQSMTVDGKLMTADGKPVTADGKRMGGGGGKGLVLPPRVAPVQLIVIPIPNSKMSEEERKAMADKAAEIVEVLKDEGVRVSSDTRDVYTPGWKYNHWEVKVLLVFSLPSSVLLSHTLSPSLPHCLYPPSRTVLFPPPLPPLLFPALSCPPSVSHPPALRPSLVDPA